MIAGRLAVPALLLFAATDCLADGIPFKGDRVDGRVTVIELNGVQVRQADSGQYPVITLTLLQESRLLAASGAIMREVEVWTVAEAKDTCTCELSNMGIRFEKNKIEIPHAYLHGLTVPYWGMIRFLIIYCLLPLLVVEGVRLWARSLRPAL